MSLEVTIAGEGCRLVLQVHGYEFRDAGQLGSDDANWLRGRVDLVTGQTGRFTAQQDVFLRTTELARFRDALRGAVDSLAGEATLDHLEGQLGCVIRLDNGKGELEAFVCEHVGAELRVANIRTDQSYLTRSVQELDAILAAFPVRMGGAGKG